MGMMKLVKGLLFILLFGLTSTANAADSTSNSNSFLFDIFCSPCHWFFASAKYILDSSLADLAIELYYDWICPILTPIPNDYCSGTGTNVSPTLYHILTRKYTDGDMICSWIGLCSNPSLIVEDPYEYVENLLATKPSSPTIPQITGLIEEDRDIRLMVITDIHLDQKYEEGRIADCAVHTCCREGLPYASNGETAGGEFGYVGNCDTPPIVVQSLIESEIDEKNPDIILWLGDSVGNYNWEYEKATHMQPVEFVTNLLKEKYPSAGVVFPALGNHEGFPTSQFDIFGFSTNWVLEEAAEMWSQWLTADSMTSMKEKGWYTQLVGESNLRIIIMSPFLYDPFNYYTWINSTDVWGELDWLVETFQKAEIDGEAVILAGHNPPTSLAAIPDWTIRFEGIIERFSHIIRGTYAGHIHLDFWQLTRAYYTGEPTSVVYANPCMTTHVSKNPSYKLYELSHDYAEVKNARVFTLNVGESNIRSYAIWEESYNFLDYFGIQSMSLTNLDSLISSFRTNESMYYKFITVLAQRGAETVEKFKAISNGDSFWFCNMRYGNYRSITECTRRLNAFWIARKFMNSEFIVDSWFIDSWIRMSE